MLVQQSSQKNEAFLLRGLVHRLSAECLQLLEALLVVAHLLKDRHVVPGGEQLDILGHMAKREALIISASIINTDVLQLLLIVGYLPMQKFLKIFPRTSSVEISPTMEPRW